ncbi:hypothetical protein Y032_0008g105 [Ancylostoma ceylanicum]|uniref:Uncharacterized protein n=1 Tax=Ancylostoma ceylanicum TaxID=53326 RepID=A0A016VJ72_9BILA|nr:hypothetical protein Y032_0008g105 [Ancylostoma ceylanicum]
MKTGWALVLTVTFWKATKTKMRIRTSPGLIFNCLTRNTCWKKCKVRSAKRGAAAVVVTGIYHESMELLLPDLVQKW